MLYIGIDVGGTFTDLVAVDHNGKTALAKSPSTPHDQTEGVFNGLAILARSLETSVRGLLSRTERIVHGTTVATNALLERKGAKVALLTTAGHRDILEMREGLKDDRYNLCLPPPHQIIPRHLRYEVDERIRPNGSIISSLDVESLRETVDELKFQKVESVAICYLHSYRFPAHERETREFLAQHLPNAYLSLSSEVIPQIKEFDRFSTTAVNAYVGPVLSRYLQRLEKRLNEAGYQRSPLIIQSHGGVVSVTEAARIAAGCVLSGPAGGVAGSRYACSTTNIPNLISFDMGGTSTDLSLIVDGQATLATGRSVGGQRVALNSLDIVTLGAGGGSIAKVDSGGILHVGPGSAGAIPGPACYQQGGTEATVTDANVVLGLLDAHRQLGGGTRLDLAAANVALDEVASRLGADRLAAARAIYQIVNSKMADGIRLVSVKRGVDPRRFAILSFGGASGLHITEVARQSEISRVIVPRAASVLSAWGMLATDLRVETAHSMLADTDDISANELRDAFQRMEQDSLSRLSSVFKGEVRRVRSAEMRYGEQIFEINVPLDDVRWADEDPVPKLVNMFHQQHEELYGYSLPEQPVILVNLKSASVGILPTIPKEAEIKQTRSAMPFAERKVFLGEWFSVPVFEMEALSVDQSIIGPALVESSLTTIFLHEHDAARVTSSGWLDIAVGASDKN